MFLFKLSDFRQAGMPVRAITATREDALAAARGLGIGDDDAHIEMIDANEAALRDVLLSFLGGHAPTRRWPVAGADAAAQATVSMREAA